MKNRKSMQVFKLFLMGIFLVFNLKGICQVDNQLPENSSIDTIPFVLTDHNNISIEVVLNNKDTLDLMLHTAASSVSLIRDVTEEITTIDWNESDKVESWGGESTSRSSNGNTLKIGGLEWDDISIWDCENSGPLTDGKFGLDFFPGKTIEINFDQKIILLHESLPAKVEGFVKLKLNYRDGMMFITGISITGESTFDNQYLIHSGYAGAILYDDEFVASSKIGDQLDIIGEKELKDSYGHVIKVKKASLPAFKLDNIEFDDLPVGFFEGTIRRQQMSVLGGDILKRCNLIIGAEKEYIYLQPNSLMNLPYSKV